MRPWLDKLFRNARAPKSTIPFARFKPSVELLEDRNLLSTVFLQSNLVSDIPGVARFTDPNLVNPWGIAASPNGPFWISDNGMGLSTLYNGNGSAQSLVVSVPLPLSSAATNSAPTGIVFNGTTDFTVTSGTKTGVAAFIFAAEDGTISAWSPTVSLNNAILEVDNSANPTAATGAVYKGLAMGSNANGNFLFAANFRSGKIDVFDKAFQPATLAGNFTDANLPAGFAPFGIANINGNLYVTYALQNAAKHDDVAGAGNGFVDVFDTSGHFVKRFASQGTLNSPWGVVMAPSTFGAFAGTILVGNFGDGRISAFDATTGAFKGQLQTDLGTPLTINGLWGLEFGNGVTAGDPNTLFFTAGIGDEGHGLFGSIRAETSNEHFLSQVYLDLLKRPIDGFGLGFWSSMLNQGASRAQVVLGIENTTEFHSVTVQGLYQKFLHRTADPMGLSAFTTLLDHGATIEQVEEIITSSPEYFQSRGGGTNDGFVTALYQDALSRAVDPTGRMVFDQFLAMNGSRMTVATIIFTSPEFRQDLVQGDYLQFLHRPADPTGLAAFTNALNMGARDEQVNAGLIGSAEFLNAL
jgi:uncharacterized protein (TIGR03118 family)